MPLTAKVHIWPQNILAEVNERGNVCIVGQDPDTGAEVMIEIHSASWPTVYEKLGRMKGVGIHKVNRKIEVVTDD